MVKKKYLYISHLEALIVTENVRRQKLGRPPLTQEELEEGTGVSRQTIHRWRQTSKPLTSVNKATVDGLIRFFGVSEEQLYTVVEQHAPAEQSAQRLATLS